VPFMNSEEEKTAWVERKREAMCTNYYAHEDWEVAHGPWENWEGVEREREERDEQDRLGSGEYEDEEGIRE
jgi:hypothetical protein